MKRSLVALGISAILLTGVTACSDSDQDDYVTQVQYGYYDSHHHYHYYSTPKKVRIKSKYYKTHKYQYQPHGTQHRVIIRTITTTNKYNSFKSSRTTRRH